MPPKLKSEQDADLTVIKFKLDSVLTQIAIIEVDLKSRFALAADLQQLREEFNKSRDSFVTQDQYNPVKILVYGFVGLILTGAVGSILALIYRTHQ
jgi:hypothetical protein